MYIYPYNNPYAVRVQENRDNKNNMIFEGKGIVKAKPDIVVINIGVVTQNNDLMAAQAENAQKTNTVINTLESKGIEEKDIRTQNYSIEPMYEYIDGRQEFKGYRVVNNLSVTIRNINAAGAIIDSAVAGGSNIVNNISYSLSDPSRYYNKALILAVRNTIEKAGIVAAYLKVDINQVPFNIIEEGYDYAPVYEGTMLKAAVASTPIQPGEIEVTARVKAQFNY